MAALYVALKVALDLLNSHVIPRFVLISHQVTLPHRNAGRSGITLTVRSATENGGRARTLPYHRPRTV